jgi:hypothetical protein
MPHVSELHAQHDLLLVASLAAGDLAGADRDHAAAQIADCADCATVHADLIAIARATAALPPAVAPRDFRLSPEQAAALRPVGWRRLIAAVGGSRPLMSRQLGIGLATIGLAGLLVSTLPGIQLGGTAAAPAGAPAEGSAARLGAEAAPASGAPADVAGEGEPSAAPAQLGPVDQASAAASAAPPVPTRSSGDAVGVYGGSSEGGPTAAPAGGVTSGDTSTSGTDRQVGTSAQLDSRDGTATSDQGRGLLVAGSLLLLAAGIALLLIRRLVRRPSWS